MYHQNSAESIVSAEMRQRRAFVSSHEEHEQSGKEHLCAAAHSVCAAGIDAHTGLVSISVQALVDAAGVGRASFYRNFASKEDVLQQESVRLTNEWKTNFDHEHPDGTPGQDNLWLVSLLDFYKDHAEFYLALYHAGLSHIMQETILGYFDRSPEIPNGLAYLNSAIGYMLYGWVHEWMNRGMQESGTEIARMFAEAQKKQA